MKSNVTLSSTDRDLFGITIRQNTKDSMLSVTDLQKSYDKARFMYGWSDRQLGTLMRTNEFRERSFHILSERNLIKMPFSTFTEMIEKEGVTKVLKGLGVWRTTGRGSNKQVVADPYVWVLIAMEMNPMLYAKVVVWLTDTLVFDRIEAGSEFMPMNTSIKSIVNNPDYPEYARLINKSVFGQHIRGIRNLASSKELRKIAYKEKFVTDCISNGMITTENQLINVLSN